MLQSDHYKYRHARVNRSHWLQRKPGGRRGATAAVVQRGDRHENGHPATDLLAGSRSHWSGSNIERRTQRGFQWVYRNVEFRFFLQWFRPESIYGRCSRNKQWLWRSSTFLRAAGRCPLRRTREQHPKRFSDKMREFLSARI